MVTFEAVIEGGHGPLGSRSEWVGSPRLPEGMPFCWAWELPGPGSLRAQRKEWGVWAPAVWMRRPGCQRGWACSGSQVLLCPQATWLWAALEPRPKELTFSVGGVPDPGIQAQVWPGGRASLRGGGSAAWHLCLHPSVSRGRGQPGHRGEVMQWERTRPLSPIDLGSAANLQCDLGWLTSHP